jgi:hypothetical protein
LDIAGRAFISQYYFTKRTPLGKGVISWRKLFRDSNLRLECAGLGRRVWVDLR